MKRYKTTDEIPYGMTQEHELLKKEGKFFDLVIERTPRLRNQRRGTQDFKERQLIYLKNGELVKDVTNWTNYNTHPDIQFKAMEDAAEEKRIERVIAKAGE